MPVGENPIFVGEKHIGMGLDMGQWDIQTEQTKRAGEYEGIGCSEGMMTRYEQVKTRREQKRSAERSLSAGGVLWFEAAVPPRFHRCYPHTSGAVSLKQIERCACGAIRFDGSPWMDKNSRRKNPRG